MKDVPALSPQQLDTPTDELPHAEKNMDVPSRVLLDPLEWGAAILMGKHGRSVSRIGESIDGIAPKNVLTRLYAAAEACVLQQKNTQEAVLEHVKAMTNLGMWKAHMYIEHLSYDETSLEIRSYYTTDEIDKEVAKVFVVEHSWSMLVERLDWSLPTHDDASTAGPGKFLVLEGNSSPSMRASKGGSGLFTLAVLRTCPQPPQGVESVFDMCVRLAETDEGGANPVAEALAMRQRATSSATPSWSHAYMICLAHKVHSCSTKLWSMHEETLSSIIHTCKTLLTSGTLSTLRDTASALLLDRFVRLPSYESPMDDAGLAFRTMVTKYFLPPTSTPKRRSTVLACLQFFNGDLRNHKVTHICQNCCISEDQSREKAWFLFRRLFQVIRPKMFARNNWVDWSSTLVFFGLADGFHHVIVDAFQKTFSGKLPQTLEPAPSMEPSWDFLNTDAGPSSTTGTAQEDAQQRMREEQAYSLKVSLSGMLRGLWHRVVLLRVPLEPARGLMEFLTHSISQEWEEKQMKTLWELGCREYRALLLHRGDVLGTFFRDTLLQFQDAALWQGVRADSRISEQSLQVYIPSWGCSIPVGEGEDSRLSFQTPELAR